jgi:hypothetical protein
MPQRSFGVDAAGATWPAPIGRGSRADRTAEAGGSIELLVCIVGNLPEHG